MGLCSRLDNLEIKTLSGKAKILGSLVGVAGATILTFFKGMELNFSTSVNLLKPHSNGGHDQTLLHYESGDRIMGSILAAKCARFIHVITQAQQSCAWWVRFKL
ncbi:WAT1-related protein [Platanthera guangdongensis]|uniref:WAT1-related protein n=1 Tax=Platanthera guangdongensis TaxID=2320717 RepID=A0ABR2MBK3_9ASPA